MPERKYEGSVYFAAALTSEEANTARKERVRRKNGQCLWGNGSLSLPPPRTLVPTHAPAEGESWVEGDTDMGKVMPLR